MGRTLKTPEMKVSELLAQRNGVRYWRRRKGIKQVEMAAMLRINKSWLSAIENSYLLPTPDLLERISEILEKPVTLIYFTEASK